MKHPLLVETLIYLLFAALIGCSGYALSLEVPKPKPPLNQPTDNHTRAAKFLDAHDGDTARFEITLCDAPEVHLVRKIRLKGVRCLEIPETGPAEPDAIKERDALRDILSKARFVTVVLDKSETHDRIQGVVWADGVNVCEVMRTYPQGGR